jgi:hypothetical protein
MTRVQVYVSLFRMTRSQDWMIPVIAAYRGCEPLGATADDCRDDKHCSESSDSEGTESPPRRRKVLQSVIGKGFRGAYIWTVPEWVSRTLPFTSVFLLVHVLCCPLPGPLRG